MIFGFLGTENGSLAEAGENTLTKFRYKAFETK